MRERAVSFYIPAKLGFEVKDVGESLDVEGLGRFPREPGEAFSWYLCGRHDGDPRAMRAKTEAEFECPSCREPPAELLICSCGIVSPVAEGAEPRCPWCAKEPREPKHSCRAVGGTRVYSVADVCPACRRSVEAPPREVAEPEPEPEPEEDRAAPAPPQPEPAAAQPKPSQPKPVQPKPAQPKPAQPKPVQPAAARPVVTPAPDPVAPAPDPVTQLPPPVSRPQPSPGVPPRVRPPAPPPVPAPAPAPRKVNPRPFLLAAGVLAAAVLAIWLISGRTTAEPVVEPEPVVPAGLGTLELTVTPPARASLDGWQAPDQGSDSPSSRLTFSALEPQTYSLKVWQVGFETLDRSVSVNAGEVTRLDLELEPQ